MTTERRNLILKQLQTTDSPISASKLASKLSVSRQIIVGDVALLRVAGHEIIATARGYTMALPSQRGGFTRKIVCQHAFEDTEIELTTIVELGGTIIDVIVEHEIYGEITGQLEISNRQEVIDFIKHAQDNDSRLLSELTDGIHMHTIVCQSATVFKDICNALDELSLLYHG